jgi:hypothetical protein
MEDHDQDFERYLRQFRPKAPAALPGPRRTALPAWRLRLAVAAATIVICSLAGWFFVRKRYSPGTTHRIPALSASRQTTPSAGPPDISLGRLKILMGRDPSGFDAALMSISRRLLPNVENPQGTLYVLAGE